MQEYLKEENPNFKIGLAELIAALGFLMIVVANFLSFAPIEERTWREIGVGFPVMLISVVGIILVIRRRFFSAFMIGMFAAFFITHEIIICYDNKAIEIRRELGPDGWFRLVAMVFHDAMNMAHGSFWGVAGSSLAVLAILVGWPLKVYQENQAVVPAEELLNEDAAASSADYAETETEDNIDDSSAQEVTKTGYDTRKDEIA